jgi:hypothetical protein
MPITMHYHCQKTGEVKTGLDLLVDVVDDTGADGKYNPVGVGMVRRISFYWIKQCVVEPLTELGARTIDSSLFTLDASLTYNHDYPHQQVVHEGLVNPAFDRAAKSTTVPLFIVDASKPVFAMELFKHNAPVPLTAEEKAELSKMSGGRGRARPAPHTAISFRTPVLTSSSPDIVKVNMRSIGEMERLVALGKKDYLEENGPAALKRSELKRLEKRLDLKADFDEPVLYQVSSGNKVYLVVDHICTASGSADITLELPMRSTTEKVYSISWRKECSWSNAHLTHSKAGGAVAFGILGAVLLTSAVFFLRVRKQRQEIAYLEQLDFSEEDRETFEKMDVE